ncbi:winged helix-turn-helix transcriptional regulator [Allostreptomyces psammosilenae]|uniref:DNA-binding HxlR family transcriptional regulator n=1 Tax=Allostreptomyces psammosilenae TaxID=1892865 RepID=A0A852ZPB2_9ACTN|nr:winged helix-turn-helix transcriptional regulator [Allostreptomyces psammosilenae]NYI03565.1 DNA-binding HxlR family transcriptional regulator [Allostreptomyces psammosilenae]
MPRRSYAQYCAVARALDAVGERWTLLIVRELLGGARRYTDLHADLPGVSTDVLASRLKEMERDGVVERRRLPAPASASVYELTERGRGLLPVLTALAEWGAEDLGVCRETDARHGHWFALPLLGVLKGVAGDCGGVVEVRIEGAVFQLVIGEEPAWVAGAAEAPDVLMTLDAETATELVSGNATVAEAAKEGKVRLLGDGMLAEALRTR